MKIFIYGLAACLLVFGSNLLAECGLDHLYIGVNEDGVAGTADDNKLFVDCTHKYRHAGETEYGQRFYTQVYYEEFESDYAWRVFEPGFDVFQSSDPDAGYSYAPEHSIEGVPEQDHDLMLMCVGSSGGLQWRLRSYPEYPMEGGIDTGLAYSNYFTGEGSYHMDVSYEVEYGEVMHWISFRVEDDCGPYETSEPFTIVFNAEPLAGDLVVDGVINEWDLEQFFYYWLCSNAGVSNDYCERADVNHDGEVGLEDFAVIAANWMVVYYEDEDWGSGGHGDIGCSGINLEDFFEWWNNYYNGGN